jgi:lipopolysaccharide exporter
MNRSLPDFLCRANSVGEGGANWRLSRFFRKGSFGQQVLTLMSATVIGQVITVLAAPILTRIYDPAAFGVYAMYATVLMLSVPLVCGRYELAIVPAETDDEAFGLLLISCTIAVFVGVATLFALQMHRAMAFLGLEPIAKYSITVAVSVTVYGFLQILIQFWIREKRFSRIGGSEVWRSMGMTGAQVSIGEMQSGGPSGMMIGQLVGVVLSIIILGRTLPGRLASWKARHRGNITRTLRNVAVRHRDHPIFLPWGGFVNALGSKLPVLMLSVFYGPVFLGMYSLADRLLRTPSTLIGQTSAQVLFQKMTEPDVKATMPRLIRMWAAGMTVLSALPFVLLFFFGRPFFAFALGKRWAPAGDIAAALIPIYWAGLVVSPLSSLLIIGKRQALAVSIQAVILVVGFGSLWLGHRIFRNGVQMLGFYSIAQWCVYMIYYAALFATAKSVAENQKSLDQICVA